MRVSVSTLILALQVFACMRLCILRNTYSLKSSDYPVKYLQFHDDILLITRADQYVYYVHRVGDRDRTGDHSGIANGVHERRFQTLADAKNTAQ